MHKIREYRPYKGVPIFRDYNVVDEEKVYIGNGQGCHTFWFRSVAEARIFIDHYIDKIKVGKFGHVAGLIPKSMCKRCQYHYSTSSEEYKKYPPHVCDEHKRKLIRAALQG